MLPSSFLFPTFKGSQSQLEWWDCMRPICEGAPPYFSAAGWRTAGPNFQKWRIQSCVNGGLTLQLKAIGKTSSGFTVPATQAANSQKVVTGKLPPYLRTSASRS